MVEAGDINALREMAKIMPALPGVYRMIGADEVILYVGKARNLRNRVSSYFRASGLSNRIQSMVSQVVDIEITVTHSENEALILENNLIKSLNPRYNVLLRDDKSYPYIYLSDHVFPELRYHRGARKGKGRYFGPYPSSSSARESLHLLQKLFRVRQCRDSYFSNRSRPCLQYQIKRCRAPCVGLVTDKDYADDVRHTTMFLEGKSREVNDEILQHMEQASANLEFEQAAVFRDQLAALTRVQEQQFVGTDSRDTDILAVAVEGGLACVSASFVRGGRNLGSKAFFPKFSVADDSQDLPADILEAFVSQFYQQKQVPTRIMISINVSDPDLLAEALGQQSGHKVQLLVPERGDGRRWMQMAQINAEDALRRRLATHASLRIQFEQLTDALALSATPERIECFDISHTNGTETVASCVVFGPEGPLKSDYRRFNIKDIQPGDDYAAMRQALSRRYTRAMDGEHPVPDLLLIDGGKGQLGVAAEILEELQVVDVTLVGVAKGRERIPGKERLFLWPAKDATILPPHSPALHLIQQVRDEAHRFAITGHRARRARSRKQSSLEQIPGVGDKRRQALLKHFGGLQEVARAGVNELAKVPGISQELAQKIFDALHA
ncbi:MAG: excinuclease ABC subunit UvrC [Gammaproteobacteria bacterium]|nr:excinuclease ABC subunit UvrC [Gammaproteobacteria bacterium]